MPHKKRPVKMKEGKPAPFYYGFIISHDLLFSFPQTPLSLLLFFASFFASPFAFLLRFLLFSACHMPASNAVFCPSPGINTVFAKSPFFASLCGVLIHFSSFFPLAFRCFNRAFSLFFFFSFFPFCFAFCFVVLIFALFLL